MSKTHWLQSPNKNYLGHWDLPENKDFILTIASAKWEVVENPILRTQESKRVIRFKEKVKPLICNQTNAQSIVKSTGVKYMEDSAGQKIALYIDNIKDKRTKEDIDCIRIRRKFTGDQDNIKKEISELFANTQHLLTEAEFNRARDILSNNQVRDFDKLKKHLETLKIA